MVQTTLWFKHYLHSWHQSACSFTLCSHWSYTHNPDFCFTCIFCSAAKVYLAKLWETTKLDFYKLNAKSTCAVYGKLYAQYYAYHTVQRTYCRLAESSYVQQQGAGLSVCQVYGRVCCKMVPCHTARWRISTSLFSYAVLSHSDFPFKHRHVINCRRIQLSIVN